MGNWRQRIGHQIDLQMNLKKNKTKNERKWEGKIVFKGRKEGRKQGSWRALRNKTKRIAFKKNLKTQTHIRRPTRTHSN